MKFVPNEGESGEALDKGFTKLSNRVPMAGDNVFNVGEMRDDSGYFGASNIPDVRWKKKRFEDQG